MLFYINLKLCDANHIIEIAFYLLITYYLIINTLCFNYFTSRKLILRATNLAFSKN